MEDKEELVMIFMGALPNFGQQWSHVDGYKMKHQDIISFIHLQDHSLHQEEEEKRCRKFISFRFRQFHLGNFRLRLHFACLS